VTSPGVRVERVITRGTFSLDGETFDVDNNVWLCGDDSSVVVIDAAHDAGAIADAVAGRLVSAILCTHGHDDHIGAAVELAALVDAPVALHPADRMLWEAVHPGCVPDIDLASGVAFAVAGQGFLRVLHTPGHSPGSVCFYGDFRGDGVLFSGDTLFRGGPGATGRSYSDFGTIITSIRDRLLVLPASAVVHTGHGADTTIGDEAPHLHEWIARGH
jgi:glyoxylase-like metal-dependent hydrolase (beta-lactamase superfamily II)